MVNALRVTVVTLCCVIAAGCVSAPAVPVEPTGLETPPGPERPSRLVEDILALRVEAEHPRDGYDRADWPHWRDVDGDGCTARHRVLADESLAEEPEADCRHPRGPWISPYDGLLVADPSALDVDHLVPLAEVHDSGGHSWDAERRLAYANDTDDPRTLVAVSAASNRAKGDKDPAEWMPGRGRCGYVADWVAVKHRWGLSADPQERDALLDHAAECADGPHTLVPHEMGAAVSGL